MNEEEVILRLVDIRRKAKGIGLQLSEAIAIEEAIKTLNHRKGEGEETRAIIDETVNTTVLKMKMAGLLKDDRKTATEKTEELLRNYPTFKKITGKEYTEKLVAAVEAALDTIRNDPYFDVINRFYFNGQSRDFIAQAYGTSTTTISRNKTRLIKELTPLLFSDEVIFELFL